MVAAASAAPALPSNPANFVQTEGNTVIDTTLNAGAVDIQGGRLGGHGVIQASTVTIGPGGLLAPGNSPGTLTIAGNLAIIGSSYPGDPLRLLGGVLEIEIAGTGAGEYDVLNVSGQVSFAPGSVLSFVLYDIYNPGNGDDFRFLYSSGLVGLEHVRYTISGLPSGFHYQVYEDRYRVYNTQTHAYEDHADLHVRFYSDAVAGAAALPDEEGNLLYDGRQIPEPSTLALGALGFALMGWRVRRRPVSGLR